MSYNINDKVFHVETQCEGVIIEKDIKNNTYYVNFGKFGKWCGESEIKFIYLMNEEI